MKQQRGGTFLGFVLGLVVGLGAALAVAVYVTKVPVPFLDKGANRPVDQDAAESKKNIDWDPNAPLYGKNPARPASSVGLTAPPAKVSSTSDTAAVAHKPAVTADPLGDLVRAKDAAIKAAASKGVSSAPQAPSIDLFIYFVQVGAFRTPEEAEGQRAKLSLAGIETKVTEREQAGRLVHRVRVGPFETREEVDKAKAKLDASGLDTALVRVQR